MREAEDVIADAVGPTTARDVLEALERHGYEVRPRPGLGQFLTGEQAAYVREHGELPRPHRTDGSA